ncbi:MAG: UMP kinase [Waddliaceae bacterium]|nr:UMP kinase [Waddliaceae bacterium]
MNFPYKRILLKLSGESLLGNQGYGINKEACHTISHSIKELIDHGIQVGVVIGAGNIFRGNQGAALGLDKTPADHMGMLATIMNSIALEQTLNKLGAQAVIYSALECPRVAHTFRLDEVNRSLEEGRVVIFSGGTGNPYFTTDSAGALRASEIRADILLKATTVDGVYDKDPRTHSDAKKYEQITYSQVLAENLRVMDATATALCMDNKIPIYVFNIFDNPSIVSVLNHLNNGTLVKET